MELAGLKKQRASNKRRMTQIVNFVDQCDDQTPVEDLKTSLMRAEELMSEFTDIESLIFSVNPDEDSDFQYDEIYYEAITGLNTLIHANFASINMIHTGGQAEVVQPNDGGTELSIKAFLLPKITTKLSIQSINEIYVNANGRTKLADPNFHISNTTQLLSPAEQLCEDNFREAFQKTDGGKFIVSRPFQKSPNSLGNSMNSAVQKLRSMQCRFIRDPEFKDLYHKFMLEYHELQRKEEIPQKEIYYSGIYLPHHGVLCKSSSTTKLRVVFHGSAQISSGIYINDCLAVDPTFQSPLDANSKGSKYQLSTFKTIRLKVSTNTFDTQME